MSSFLTLFKYELKKQFPLSLKKGKADYIGAALSLVITLVVIGMCVFLVSVISQNYVMIKVNKVLDSSARAYELLNLFYNFMLVLMTITTVERMRKTFSDKTDKDIFLPLPIKPQTLFLTKLLVLVISIYIMALLFVLPINIIIYIALKPAGLFWLGTAVVWVATPLVVLLLATIFLVPYIKLVDMLKSKYWLLFVLLTIVLAGTFALYSAFLALFRDYLESGFIRFLFNEGFINFMQNLLAYTYPANSLAGIALGKDLVKSSLVATACCVLSLASVYFVIQKLFFITLYKTEVEIVPKKKTISYKPSNKLIALIKKEFIAVIREPRHIFSYFVIATAMPIMTYCCYTLFESLIVNMIGLKLTFELALFIILIFSVLTNTFCATNITREREAILKQKTLPLRACDIVNAKILFCAMVSSLAVVVAAILLVVLTPLNIWQGVVCMIIGAAFSIAQIIFATMLDLKSVNLSLSPIEIENQSTKTITKVIALGLVLALVLGVGCLLLGMLARGVMGIKVSIALVYLLPIIVCGLYLVLSTIYCKKYRQKYLNRIVR